MRRVPRYFSAFAAIIIILLLLAAIHIMLIYMLSRFHDIIITCHMSLARYFADRYDAML